MGMVEMEYGQSRIYWSAYLNSGYGKDWIKVEARFDASKISDEDRALVLEVIDYAKHEMEVERMARQLRERKAEAEQG